MKKVKNKIVKINKEYNIYEENHINEEYLYDPDPEFSENELKQILKVQMIIILI